MIQISSIVFVTLKFRNLRVYSGPCLAGILNNNPHLGMSISTNNVKIIELMIGSGIPFNPEKQKIDYNKLSNSSMATFIKQYPRYLTLLNMTSEALELSMWEHHPILYNPETVKKIFSSSQSLTILKHNLSHYKEILYISIGIDEVETIHLIAEI